MENKKQRKLIIMQSLAGMLEERELMKITTAELAKRSEITEAAIYKHFPKGHKNPQNYFTPTFETLSWENRHNSFIFSAQVMLSLIHI